MNSGQASADHFHLPQSWRDRRQTGEEDLTLPFQMTDLSIGHGNCPQKKAVRRGLAHDTSHNVHGDAAQR